MTGTGAFWSLPDELVASSSPAVDRPAGSTHPRHPARTHPLDHGHLEGTRAGDVAGIDVWIGSQPAHLIQRGHEWPAEAER